MKTADSQTLLAEYVRSSSEAAFRELVHRYIDLVYSTALRLVGGDTHLAEDITQVVFAALAQKARTLSSEPMLGGWLHRHTCYVAATTKRTERRRQARERQAMELNALEDHTQSNLARIAPVLDDAINQLGAEDRAAILLRFYERRDFRSLGEVLGSSEDAARMRVSRALDKLQSLLTDRGVTLSGAALGTVLASGAVTAAPAGLTLSVSGTALTSVATGGAVLTVLKAMSISKLKVMAFSAIAASILVAPLIVQRQSQSQARLREENTSLRQQNSQLASEIERLSNLVAKSSSESLTKEQLSELLRLRAEVTERRQQKRESLAAARLAQQRSSLDTSEVPADITLRFNFPKDSWKPSGYGTPEAALQTAMWSIREGDINALLASLVPETAQKLKEDWATKSENQIRAEIAQSWFDPSKITEFRIHKQVNISEKEIQYFLTVPEPPEKKDIGSGLTQIETKCVGIGVTAKRVDNEWKLNPDP